MSARCIEYYSFEDRNVSNAVASYLSNNYYDNHASGLVSKLQYHFEERKSIVEHCLQLRDEINVLPIVKANNFIFNANLFYSTETLNGKLLFVDVL